MESFKTEPSQTLGRVLHRNSSGFPVHCQCREEKKKKEEEEEEERVATGLALRIFRHVLFVGFQLQVFQR